MDEDETLFARRTHLAPEIDAGWRSTPSRRSRDLATAFRIPNAPIGDGANMPILPHFPGAPAFVRNPRDGFLPPGHPYRPRSRRPAALGPAPRLGEHTGADRIRARAPVAPPTGTADGDRLPFSGLRVLDMTAFWAGPSMTHSLAMLGADVIHLESTTRSDGVAHGRPPAAQPSRLVGAALRSSPR